MTWILLERLQISCITSLSVFGCCIIARLSCGLSNPVDILRGIKKFTVRTIVPDTTDGNLNVVWYCTSGAS